MGPMRTDGRPTTTTASGLRAWLRRLKREHRLSRSEVARRLGVHRSSVTRWAKGQQAAPSWLERALRDVERECRAAREERAS
jgi:transcriptional regulator with XRE-family HTH domain